MVPGAVNPYAAPSPGWQVSSYNIHHCHPHNQIRHRVIVNIIHAAYSKSNRVLRTRKTKRLDKPSHHPEKKATPTGRPQSHHRSYDPQKFWSLLLLQW